MSTPRDSARPASKPSQPSPSLRRLSVRQLEYFVAAAEQGSFSAAARVCFVAQPSLSAAIAQAEKTLGTALFHRHARSVELTAAGKAALERARAALRAIDSVADATQWHGVVRVGIDPDLAHLLPTWLTRSRHEHPDTLIRPSVVPSATLADQLAMRDIDAYIAVGPAPASSAARALGHDELLLVVGRNDPLGILPRTWLRKPSAQDPAALADLASRDLLIAPEGPVSERARQLLATIDGRYIALPGATPLTLIESVAAGLGVSLLPASALPSIGDRSDVKVCRIESAPSLPLSFTYLPARAKAPELKALARLAKAVVTDAAKVIGRG